MNVGGIVRIRGGECVPWTPLRRCYTTGSAATLRNASAESRLRETCIYTRQARWNMEYGLRQASASAARTRPRSRPPVTAAAFPGAHPPSATVPLELEAGESTAGVNALARGRLLTFAGVLFLCLDAPTLRLAQLVGFQHGSAAYGWAFVLWRSVAGVLFLSALQLARAGRAAHAGGSGMRRSQWALVGAAVTRLREEATEMGGWRIALLGTLLMTSGQALYPLALSLTSAANVVVVFASGPLLTALLCRAALGQRLAPVTWAASIAAIASVALVFAGSVDSAQGGLLGCSLAAAAIMSDASFWTLQNDLTARLGGDVSSSICLLLACIVNIPLAIAALTFAASAGGAGGAMATLAGALPASAADGAWLCFNAFSANVGLLLVNWGCQTTPAPEVSLTMLLETALSPLLVLAFVGERPGAQTVVAGLLITATLALHALWGLRSSAPAEGRAEGAGKSGRAPHGAELSRAGEEVVKPQDRASNVEPNTAQAQPE